MDDQKLGLIDDRPVASSDDRLGHAAIVDQLLLLATTVQPPANIALYGRWGSGKSSIARALKDAVDKDPNATWVGYDAFKWSGQAFRRHFLRQVAHQLGQDDVLRDEELYSTITTNFLDVTKGSLKTAIRSSMRLLVPIIIALALLVLIPPIIARNFESAAPAANALADFLQPLAVLSLIATVAVRLLAVSFDNLTVTKKTEPMTGEEQFEQAFDRLVDSERAQGRRLVVFIDELDRCSARDVVDTLDAIRTFIDVEGSVCIVAADQHALELALSRAVRQETPRDEANPYYSTGGAYLDKVFGYQIALPPPLTRRLTSVAAELAKEAGGVWDCVSDVDEIVSVLVPSHVTSPRRMKTLLNAYAVAYRLVEARIADDAVIGPMTNRQIELAKLVCLQVEFPLFARELAEDDGLVAAMTQAAEADGPRDRRSRREAMVADFRATARPVEEVITDDESAATESPHADDGNERESPAVTATTRTATVELIDQLSAYLLRTKHVPDPAPDLIHLEGVGATHGLDLQIAREVETLAINNQATELQSRLTDLAPEDRSRAMLVLASALRDASGLEVDNLISSVFTVMSSFTASEIGTTSDTVLDALASRIGEYELPVAQMPGALVLGLASSRSVRAALLAKVFADPDDLTVAELGSTVLAHADQIPDEYRDGIAKALAHLACDNDSAARVARSVAKLDPALSSDLLRRSTETVLDLVKAPSDDAAGDPDDDSSEETEGSLPHEEHLDAYHNFVLELPEGNDTVAWAVVPFLKLNQEDARDLVETLLPRLGKVTDDTPGFYLLREAARRLDWSAWLDRIAFADFAESEDIMHRFERLVDVLWGRMLEESKPEHEKSLHSLRVAAKQLGYSPAENASPPPDLSKLAHDAPTTQEEAEPHRRRAELAPSFGAAGLLDEATAAELLWPVAESWVQLPTPAAADGSVDTSAYTNTRREMEPVIAYVLDHHPSKGDDLLEILSGDDCQVPSPLKELLTARAASASPNASVHRHFAAKSVQHLVNNHPGGAEIAHLWLRSNAHEADEVWAALGRKKHEETPGSEIPAGLEAWSKVAAQDQMVRYLTEVATDPLAESWTWESLARPAVNGSQAAIAEGLVDAWVEATNNPHREHIFSLWSWLAPDDVEAARTLVEGVFLAQVKLATDKDNQGAADVAADFAGLVENPPHGTKGRVETAVAELLEVDPRGELRKRFKRAGVRVPRAKRTLFNPLGID